MRKQDVQIVSGGKIVSCRVDANTMKLACQLAEVADANPPLGYRFHHTRIAARNRGGAKRWVTLVYRHTGTPKYAPEDDWEVWNEILAPEQAIGRSGD